MCPNESSDREKTTTIIYFYSTQTITVHFFIIVVYMLWPASFVVDVVRQIVIFSRDGEYPNQNWLNFKWYCSRWLHVISQWYCVILWYDTTDTTNSETTMHETETNWNCRLICRKQNKSFFLLWRKNIEFSSSISMVLRSLWLLEIQLKNLNNIRSTVILSHVTFVVCADVKFRIYVLVFCKKAAHTSLE